MAPIYIATTIHIAIFGAKSLCRPTQKIVGKLSRPNFAMARLLKVVGFIIEKFHQSLRFTL